MVYEKTGEKVNKDTAKNAKSYALNNVGTGTLLWHLVKRHKFGIVATYAVILTVMYIFPPAPDLIKSIF